MEKMKKTTLLGDLLYSYAKGRNLLKTAGDLMLTFYSWNTPLFVK